MIGHTQSRGGAHGDDDKTAHGGEKEHQKSGGRREEEADTEAFAEEDTHGVGQTGREGKNQKTPLAFFRKGVG